MPHKAAALYGSRLFFLWPWPATQAQPRCAKITLVTSPLPIAIIIIMLSRDGFFNFGRLGLLGASSRCARSKTHARKQKTTCAQSFNSSLNNDCSTLSYCAKSPLTNTTLSRNPGSEEERPKVPSLLPTTPTPRHEIRNKKRTNATQICQRSNSQQDSNPVDQGAEKPSHTRAHRAPIKHANH